jgi:hypothetical protein
MVDTNNFLTTLYVLVDDSAILLPDTSSTVVEREQRGRATGNSRRRGVGGFSRCGVSAESSSRGGPVRASPRPSSPIKTSGTKTARAIRVMRNSHPQIDLDTVLIVEVEQQLQPLHLIWLELDNDGLVLQFPAGGQRVRIEFIRHELIDAAAKVFQ